MFERRPYIWTVVSLASSAILSACAAGQPPVVSYLDEVTAVTITHSRTPFILSTDSTSDAARDYVQIGAIDINRMGAHQHFLWLGITEARNTEIEQTRPAAFETIIFADGGEEFQLDVIGWTADVIGASEPVYKRLYRNTVDAYYAVTIEQIRRLNNADSITFRTIDPVPKEYVPWYQAVAAKEDLSEFFRIVSQ